MDYKQAIGRIFDNLEEGKVDRAVMGCLRVARHAKDYINAAYFLRELYPDKHEVGRMIFADMPDLKAEAQKYVFEYSAERWLDVHTLDFSFGKSDDGKERNVLSIAVGEIDAELEQLERTISDIKLPLGMDPFDIAAFTDSNNNYKAHIRLRIKAANVIKTRVQAKCLNYAIQIERQISLQRKQQSFLEDVQNDVNNYFKSHCEDVFNKLQKATQLAGSNDLEDSSLLLTEVRRALSAASDHFYPAVPGKVLCSDGVERKLGPDQHLNRLQEFLGSYIPQTTSRELLRQELDHLASFMRRLNEIASKGVHADVTTAESKQGLVGLYFFFFNVIQHLNIKHKSY